MLTMNSVVLGILVSLFVSFICEATSENQKSACSESALGPIVAHQSEHILELSSKFTSMEIRLKDQEDLFKSMAEELHANMKAIENMLDEAIKGLRGSQASTYIRWGKKGCPSNSSLVYSGLVGGKHFRLKGSGTNPLCLVRSPIFDISTKPTSYGYIYGTEYEAMSKLSNKEVPCSVCRVKKASTIMVPGTVKCPPGWSKEYNGHLVTSHTNHYATQYVCLDNEPDAVSTLITDSNGLLFYYVLAQCGSLPCPPYVPDRQVTCAVCSK